MSASFFIAQVGRPGERVSHVVKTMRTPEQCAVRAQRRVGAVLNGGH